MWVIILNLIKNPKNILIAILIALLAASWLYIAGLKISKANLVIKYEREKTESQKELLKGYEHMLAQISENNARINLITQKENQIAQSIKQIKLEGRCIKDETYYQTVDSVSNNFNNSVRP